LAARRRMGLGAADVRKRATPTVCPSQESTTTLGKANIYISVILRQTKYHPKIVSQIAMVCKKGELQQCG